MYRGWQIEFESGIYTASKDRHSAMTAPNRVEIERKIDQRIENGGLRAIRVVWSDESYLVTSMAAALTDDEMLDYYAVGKEFNIGRGEHDNMVTVASREIMI